MNGQSVGAIAYDASINTAGFIKDAGVIDKTAKGLGSNLENGAKRSFSSFASTASGAFGSVADGIARLTKVAAGLFIGGAFGVGVFVKQASELQGLRASFESMTGSAKDARKVLGDLNKFSFETAFSSLEINKAAQLLLGAGLETKKLSDYMKAIGDVAGATGADLGALTLPLSQALARGKIQTQDFYQILNSGAGKLGQVLRKELADRGMGDFQKAMEEGKVTSEILFDVIQKSAQKGGFAFEGALKQSKTFNGQLSNLQETIGNVALGVLGINKATGEVDPNGVFAKISLAVQNATEWLNKNQESIKNVASVIINNAVPGITALVAAFTVAKTAAIGFGIAAKVSSGALSLPFLAAAVAITAIVAVLTFLQVKFNIFGKAAEKIKSVYETVSGAVTEAFNAIKNKVEEVVNAISGFIDRNKKAIENWATVIGTIMLPKIVQIGVQFGIAAIQATIAFAQMVASAVVNAVLISAAFVASAAKTALSWAIASAQYLANLAVMVAQTAIAAIRMAVSFALALGPIGLIAAAVVGLTVLIVNNWSTVKKWLTSFWNWLKNSAVAAWNGVKSAFSSVGSFFAGLWNTVKSKFTDIGTNIGNAVGNAFKTAVNGVLGFLEKQINGIVNILNGAIGAIDKVTPGKLPRVSTVSLPRLAQGGIVKATPGGVAAVIGEGGKNEAVIPLDKLESMMSVPPAQSQAPQVNINIDMKGIMASSRSDLRLVAKDLIESINEELRAKQLATIPNITGSLA